MAGKARCTFSTITIGEPSNTTRWATRSSSAGGVRWTIPSSCRRANKLDQDPDGTYRTLIVRRSRAENEGPDDVSPSGYRAELVPLRFRLTPDAATGRLNALIDITGFSSWARRNEPARVTFTPDRRLETVQSKLILGTTLKVRIKAAA